MSVRLEHVLAPVVVALDYAALSWFPPFATLTGHPEAAFRVGTLVFIVMNAGVLLLGHRKGPAGMTRRSALGPARGEPAPSRPWARWAVFATLVAAGVAYRLSAIARTPLVTATSRAFSHGSTDRSKPPLTPRPEAVEL